MRIHRLPVLAFSALTLVAIRPPLAWAQTAPEPASRAARDAENPMRMIIEASKLKVRIKPDADPNDANAADKRAAPKPAPAPKLAATPARPAAAAKAPASQALAAVEEPVAPAVAPAPAPKAPEPMMAKAAEAVPVALPLPGPVIPVSPPIAAATLAPLKLLRMVEPTLSDYALRRLRTDTEVTVGFTVNSDGSVSNVAIRSAPNRVLDAPVAEAVAQWRYQPIGEARTHSVQLVLRAGPLPQ